MLLPQARCFQGVLTSWVMLLMWSNHGERRWSDGKTHGPALSPEQALPCPSVAPKDLGLLHAPFWLCRDKFRATKFKPAKQEEIERTLFIMEPKPQKHRMLALKPEAITSANNSTHTFLGAGPVSVGGNESERRLRLFQDLSLFRLPYLDTSSSCFPGGLGQSSLQSVHSAHLWQVQPDMKSFPEMNTQLCSC